MDTRTGEIAPLRELLEHIGTGNTETLHKRRIVKRLTNEKGQYIKPINLENLSAKTRAELKKNGRAFITRNSRCPCGSGKRFKKCCMAKESD